MTLDTITMDPAAAKAAYREYQAAVRGDRSAARSTWKAEDQAIAQGYKQLAQGRALLDVGAAMRTAGLRDDGYPKLAICSAHLSRCYCHMGYEGQVLFSGSPNSWQRGEASPKPERMEYPRGTFTVPPARAKVCGTTVSTLVPIVPPTLRPKFKLEGYHTLWEVESWTLEPPRDPLLLRRLDGFLFVVLAVWDLTDLERLVLGSRARS